MTRRVFSNGSSVPTSANLALRLTDTPELRTCHHSRFPDEILIPFGEAATLTYHLKIAAKQPLPPKLLKTQQMKAQKAECLLTPAINLNI
jgi:hypothetical protein